MATIPCPSCGLPRAEDLFGVTPCPLCGHAGVLAPTHEPVGTPSQPADPPPAPPLIPQGPPRLGRSLTGHLPGFVVGVAVGVGGVLGWQAYRDQLPDVDRPAVAQTGSEASESPVTPPEPPPAPPSPVPGLEPTVPPLPSSPPVSGDNPQPKDPIAGDPPPRFGPANPFRPATPRTVQLDHSQVYAPALEPGDRAAARGHVKRLVVTGLEGGAVLDCSELDAEEVVVTGKIDGGSRLSVRSPSGRVRFLAKVDGRSRVDVRAPGGRVMFETPTDATHEGSKIDGGAVVDVLAKEAHFHGRIHGAETKAIVTLTAGGSLSFAEIGGLSRLLYKKADPADADPKVTRGRIAGGAAVTKAE